MNNLIAGFLFLSLFAGGAYMFVASIVASVRGRASRYWPSVPGEILSSKVKFFLGGSDYELYFVPEVTFSYRVNTLVFKGKRITYDAHNALDLSKAEAESVVNRYRVGSTVSVYYDPKTPHRSVLEPGLKRAFLLGISFSVLLAAGGLYGLIWLLSK